MSSHEKFYGICENKCLVEITPETVGAAVVASYSVVLTASNWSNNLQSISVTGVTADGTKTDVMASPDPADSENRTAYMENDVYIVQQLDDVVVFACESVPDRDLTVNVAVTIKCGAAPSGVSYPDGDEVAYG